MKPYMLKIFLIIAGLLIFTIACSSAPAPPAIDPGQGAQMLAGRYTTTISAEDIETLDTLDPDIASNQGGWDITLTDEGDFTAELEGQWIADGNFTVNGNSIEVYIEYVCDDCQCQANVGRYVWALEDDHLHFRKVADSCDGLALVMTAHPLTRQP